MSKQELDDFLKRKLAEREYSFKEAYWQEAERMITAHEQAKKRKHWRLFGLLALLISLSIGGIFWNLHTASELQISANTNTKSIESAADFSQENEAQEEAELPVLAEQQLENKLNVAAESKAIKAESNESVADARNDKNFQREPISKETELVDEQQVESDEQEQGKHLTQTSKALAQTTARIEEAIKIQRKENAAEGDVQVEVPNILKIKGLSAYFASILAETRELPKSEMPRLSPHQFALHLSQIVGVGDRVGESGVLQVQAQNALGLLYAYRLHPRVALQSGLLYSFRGIKDSTIVRTQTDYGLGFTQTEYRLTPKRSHSLELPLYLNYHLNGKHQFRLGGKLQYVLQVQSELQTEVRNSFGIVSVESQQVKSYWEGIDRWDYGPSVAYFFQFHPNLRLGLMGNWGLRSRQGEIWLAIELLR